MKSFTMEAVCATFCGSTFEPDLADTRNQNVFFIDKETLFSVVFKAERGPLIQQTRINVLGRKKSQRFPNPKEINNVFHTFPERIRIVSLCRMTYARCKKPTSEDAPMGSSPPSTLGEKYLPRTPKILNLDEVKK